MAAATAASWMRQARGAVPMLQQHRGVRQRRMLPPVARLEEALGTSSGSSSRRGPVKRQALITLSGHTRVGSSNDIWHGIAMVMKEVKANIEDATGTTMQAAPFSADLPRVDRKSKGSPKFMVSAFNTHIAPFSSTPWQMAEKENKDSGDEVAVAYLLKASVDEQAMLQMSDLFHTRFPGLVCTVTVGSLEDGPRQAMDSTDSPHSNFTVQHEVTGTIRLFGKDQVGQLATISEVLHNCRVTIQNLLVTTGVCDAETCEFVERVGGPLSENVLSVAAIDRATFDENNFRQQVARAAQEVGYHVTSIILDSEKLRVQQLARYYLRRKAFMDEIAGVIEFNGNNCEPGLWHI
eukprot:TRINITY_DN22582_c0_g1_i1.p1 TRINITY_DN22582_c0_g1~~TRINITY_DN22582_c0_g1_i1.p1  ORF type:complete len:350 (+),score=61.77 TRINITY_DN22582_c0_g1_i1:46-1095(+)